MQMSKQLTSMLAVMILAVIVAFVSSVPIPQVSKTPISEEALEMALNDRRYLQRQLKCALGEAPCDPVGRRLKSLAPLVLRGSCPQCSASEVKQIKKVLSYVQRNFPTEWNKVVQQYAG